MLRSTLRNIHKYLSLSIAALWLLQAATGLLNVFHREIDDWALGAVPTRLDVDALGRSVQALQEQRPQAQVSSVFAGGGTVGQFDVFVSDDAHGTHAIRMDGNGVVLRERPWAHDFADAGFLHWARILHETLLIGDRGLFLIGLSGLLLLTNLIFAVRLAWPRRGQWRAVLWPETGPSLLAKLYAWHRAVGLWLAPLALISVCAGVLVAFGNQLQGVLDAELPEPRVTKAMSTAEAITHAEAMRIALAEYPGASLSILSLPSAEAPWYRIRLLLPDDVRRVFGTTTVFVDARDGSVLANYDSRLERPNVRFFNAWYATHTGEIAGLAGRVAAMLVAAGLLVMITLGIWMWIRRRS